MAEEWYEFNELSIFYALMGVTRAPKRGKYRCAKKAVPTFPRGDGFFRVSALAQINAIVYEQTGISPAGISIIAKG
jgi:hypothetical protein